MTEPTVGYVAGVVSCSGSTAQLVARLVRIGLAEAARSDGAPITRPDVRAFLDGCDRAVAVARFAKAQGAVAKVGASSAGVGGMARGGLVSAAEVGLVLGVSSTRVRQLVAGGELEPVRTNPYMFDRAAVDELLRKREAS